MKKGIYILPNAITLCGMFAGFYSIMSSVKGNYIISAWAILIAMVFDGLDGWIARKTNSTSRFGIELDSLSDVIAFGVAPAILIFIWDLKTFGRVGFAASFMFMACGALRLARFNIQMGSSERKSFVGMPIPGAAGVMASMVIFYREIGWSPDKSYFALVLMFMLAMLMVSTIKFHSIKEIDFSKRKPFWILVVIVIGFVVILMHPEISLFSFSVLYLSSGLIENGYVFFFAKKPATDIKNQ